MRSLKPRYSLGLWLAVSITPPTAVIVARDRPAQPRRGQVAVGQLDLQPVRCEHLGGRGCEAAGLEARVVADEHEPARVVFREDPPGGVGHAAQRFVGEVGADDGSPAVGTEADVGRCSHRKDPRNVAVETSCGLSHNAKLPSALPVPALPHELRVDLHVPIHALLGRGARRVEHDARRLHACRADLGDERRRTRRRPPRASACPARRSAA